MNNIIIRAATVNDAADIANVHINSWREAYKGRIKEDQVADQKVSELCYFWDEINL